MLAVLFRCAAWWIIIHLCFTPAVFLAQKAALPPYWYLLAFGLLLLIYRNTAIRQIPLYLTNAETIAALAALIPSEKKTHFLDLGCGTGSVIAPLSVLRPDVQLTGLENAVFPFLYCRLRCRNRPNTLCLYRDIFKPPWPDCHVVYAFLSPAPMTAIWRKAQRELAPGTLFISNSFPVPDVIPDQYIELGDRRKTRLFIYRIQASNADNP